MKTFLDFIKENTTPVNNNKHDDILIIVDVQKEFNEFIPNGYIQKLNKFCKNFKKVYQIFDTTHSNKPSYKFINQKNTFNKRFGYKWFTNDIKKYTDTFILQNPKKGDLFKLGEKNEYVVYTDNKHQWFYINENLTKFFNRLKNKNVILVGGADFECLMDVDIALKSFDVNSILNHNYIYSAKTNSSQNVQRF